MRPRFHLASLFVATLVAAIFLGANLVLRYSDSSRLYPGNIRLENDFVYLDVHTRGEEWIWISQGWPFCVREQDAVTRQISPNAVAAPWVWRISTAQYFSDRRNAIANALIGILASVSTLVAVEWQIRRRVPKA